MRVLLGPFGSAGVRPRRSTRQKTLRTRLPALLLGAAAGAILAFGCRPASTAEPPASGGRSALAATTPVAQVAIGDAAPNAASDGTAPSHIFLIVFENKEYSEVVGHADAPYLNSLARRYTLADQYYAIDHPSLPNYLALLGGDTFGVTSDCTGCFVDRPNLVDQLEAAGRTWKSYQENLPAPCFLGAQAAVAGGALGSLVMAYALKHNPFLYFRDIRDNPERCRRVVPLSQLQADLDQQRVPNFVWITPNLQHSMHDASLATGDAWLAAFLPHILESEAWRQGGLLLITWDEGTSDAGCCGGARGGRVATLIVSPDAPPGTRLSTPASHYSTLRTIEELWHLPYLGRSVAEATSLLPEATGAPSTSPTPAP